MTSYVFNPRCGAQLTVAFDGRGAPNETFTIDHVRPRSATVVKNGYHEADTWQSEFDLRVLPFDPEGIASIAIRIYMWDASTGDTGREWAVDENEMIRGLADEDEIEIDKSNSSLRMRGRDYTGVLDPEWDPRNKIPVGVPLKDAVQSMLDSAAPDGTTARFEVLWEVSDDSGDPVDPASVLSNGAARSTKKKGLWVKPGKTTWEAIYDLVTQNGYIVFVRGSSVHIRDVRTLTRAGLLGNSPRIAYGRELTKLKVHRRLARERVPRIRIVYWDASNRQQFEVIYPARGGSAYSPTVLDEDGTKITTGLGLKKNEDLVIPAPSYCHDRDSALYYAKTRWELMARSESIYSISTRHLAVDMGVAESALAQDLASYLGAQIPQFNLFRLDAGSAVSVAFDPFNQETMRALDRGQRVAYLESLGYHERVAAFAADNIDKLDQFRQPYYVTKAEYRYSHGDGTEIDIEAANFAYERRAIEFVDQSADTITGAM